MSQAALMQNDDLSTPYMENIQQAEGKDAIAWMKQQGTLAATDLQQEQMKGPAKEQENRPDLPDATRAWGDASPSGAFSTVYRNIADIPLSAGHGVVDGVNNFLSTVEDLSRDFSNLVFPNGVDFKPTLDFSSPMLVRPVDPKDTSEEARGDRLPQVFDSPDTPTGHMASKVAEFLTGFAAGGPAVKGLKAASAAGKFTTSMIRGAISDFAFMAPDDERLSDLLQSVPALQNPVAEFLSSSPDDTATEGRLKNAAEGLGLGALTEGLMVAFKAMRAGRQAKAAGVTKEEVDALAESSTKAIAEQKAPASALDALGPADGALVSQVDVAGTAPQKIALRGARSEEADLLDRAGFAVDQDVFHAPVTMDGKRRYGIRREALEAEGEFGDRWTRIDTKAEEWPTLPEKRQKGAWIKEWREFGKELYNKLLNQKHTVESTGEAISLGPEGRKHTLGQRQSPEGIKALPYLPEIIQKAFKTGEYNPKHSQAKNPDMRPVTLYHSAVAIDGKPYDVQIVAKRNAQGEQELVFYDMRARGKEVTDRSTEPRLPKEKQIPTGHLKVENPSVSQNINPDTPGVNATSVNSDLSKTKVADFFGDAKDIVDDIRPADVAGEQVGPTASRDMHINFARINTPEDVREAISISADAYRGEIDAARRGKRSFEEITLSAEQEDAWKILAERRQGDPLNAEQSLAARNLWASSGQKLAETARQAAQAPTEENLFAFRKMLEVHRAVQNEVIAARTETARALASWRIPAGPKELQLRHFEDVLNGTGGIEAARDLADRVSKLSDAGMVQELEAMIAKTPATVTRESIQEAWVMGLLSGPKTHLVNMMSNTTVALQQVFERSVAARIGKLAGDETGVQVGEALAMLNGMLGGAKDGIRLAGKAFKMNEVGGWSGKMDLPHTPAISAENWNLAKDGAFGKTIDVLGQAIRLPGRALMAEDEFFKSVGYRAELHAQAYRQATREASAGKIGKDEIKERMAELLENPPDNIKMAAIDHATYSTFSNAPGKFAEGWMKFVQKNPGLRFITPFIKTPTNILSYAVAERSPVAPLFRSFREDIAAGGARQQLAMARISTSTALMLSAADLAFNGTITGSGPPSQAQRQTLMRTGWQPNSIKIGDRYFSYSRMDPLGMTFGIAADLAEVVTHMDHGDKEVDADETAVYFAASIAGSVMSKSYMRGLSDVMEVLSNPKSKAVNYAERFAGSFVPAAVAEVAKFNDPYMLEVNSMVEAMKARIPGLSEDLPARRDLWGRAISYRSGLGSFYDAISPIASRRENPEPIDNEMLRLEMYMSSASKRVDFGDKVFVDLTRFDGAYSRYAQLAGNEAQHQAWGKGCMDYLNDVVRGKSPTSSIYQARSDGPDGGKAEFIRSAIHQYREIAKKQLLEEYPELREYVEQKKAGKPGKLAF